METRFEKIYGHAPQKAALRAMLAEGRLPHALLFTGPDGIGKKRVARALATAILCTGTEPPCGDCASCRAMRAEVSEDYFELAPEAGKARPVIRIDACRAALTRVSRSAAGRGRVLLIDDAEAMNEPAANSILKTLEEPEGQVTFLLVTSAPSALLPTIRSRCIPIAFPMLCAADVAAALVAEGMAAEEAAAVAPLAGGRVGEALRLAENGFAELRDAALSLLGEGAPDLLAAFSRAEEVGAWPRARQREWLGLFRLFLRDLLVLSMDGAAELLSGEGMRGRLLAVLAHLGADQIHALLSLARETERRLQASVNPRLLFEGFLIQLRDIVGTR